MYFINTLIKIILPTIIVMLLTYILYVFTKGKGFNLYFLDQNNFINRLSLIKKLRQTKKEFKKLYKIQSKYLSTYSLLIICIILSILSFFITYFTFKTISISINFSILSFFLPIFLINYFINAKKQIIINAFPIYISSLLKQTKTNNDIILAIRNTEVIEPLDIIIYKLHLYIKEGFDIKKVIYSVKKEIQIKEVTNFFEVIKNCYTCGGNYHRLLQKYYAYFIKLNKLNEKKQEKIASTKAILFIVIALNLYFLFGVVLNNLEYKRIILESFLGEIILNINIFIYFIILIAIQKIGKVE